MSERGTTRPTGGKKALARAGKGGKKKDGLTPEQLRERDAKKAAKKAAQDAAGSKAAGGTSGGKK